MKTILKATMGNKLSTTKMCKQLNVFLKQFITLLLVLSFALPHNVIANNDPSDFEEKIDNDSNRLNFDVLDTDELARRGVNPDQLLRTNSSSRLNDGRRITIDLIQGEVKAHQFNVIIAVLEQLEPQLRRAFELNPNTKFEPVIVTAEGEERLLDATIQDVLNFINDIREGKVTRVSINQSTAQRIRGFFSRAFEKTTAEDVKWGLARLAINGTSATISLYITNVPFPIAPLLGYGLIGAASAGIAVFLEKFTEWLDHNEVNRSRPLRNRLGSIETYLLLSPLLIGLQGTGLNTMEGVQLLAGTAALSVVLQNAYYFIKKRSANAAFIYKWGATETAFVAAIPLVLPIFDIPTENIMRTIGMTFVYMAMATASQGIWEKLIVSVRRPFLDRATESDLKGFAERVSGQKIFDMTYRERTSLIKSDELLARKPYKKYFFFISVASVLASILGSAASYKGIDILSTTGKLMLGALGVSGLYFSFRQSRAEKKAASEIWSEMAANRSTTNEAGPRLSDVVLNFNNSPNLCSSLFR